MSECFCSIYVIYFMLSCYCIEFRWLQNQVAFAKENWNRDQGFLQWTILQELAVFKKRPPPEYAPSHDEN